MERAPLLTFSHLRWNSHPARPQQVMTRLGASRPVLYVEEPLLTDGGPWLEIVPVDHNIRVARPYVPTPMAGLSFGVEQQATVASLLRGQLERDGWRQYAAWIYAPSAVRVARDLHPLAIFYDCVETLAHDREPDSEILERERELLAVADAVFTADPDVHREMCARHPFVRLFSTTPGTTERVDSVADPVLRARRLAISNDITRRMNDIVHYLADALTPVDSPLGGAASALRGWA